MNGSVFGAIIGLVADVSPAFVAAPFVLVGLIVAIVGLGIALLVRARSRARLKGGQAPGLIESDAPRRDPLANRLEVDAPVQITEGMSLREIKDAKAARLTGAHRSSAETEAELARRKAGTRATAAVVEDDVALAAEAPETAAVTTVSDRALVVTPAPAVVPAPASALRPAPAPVPSPAVSREPPRTTPAAAPESSRTMVDGLSRTRAGFAARLGTLFSRARLDDDLLEELEEVLLTADIGPRAAQKLLALVQERAGDGEAAAPSQVWGMMRAEISLMLTSNSKKFEFVKRDGPTVILVVGVNGAGKTTTIGKLASRFMGEGRKVMIVAGDTFRAAAVDQLAEWGARVGCTVHRGEEEADPSGVIYNGIRQAVEDGVDVVLCDTAGRLQTKKPLMDELGKIGRSIAKAIPGAPHETVLVLDANTGQNAIQQARLFSEVTPVTGIVLTKLDGTAKGGVVIGISDELRIPIYFVGIGEAIEDLRVFDAREFAEALF